MDIEQIIILISFFSVVLHAAYFAYVCEYHPNNMLPLFFTPEDLWQKTKLNVFGCLIVYLLLIVLLPLFTIGGMLYKSIKWLFTVGRRG